MLAVVQFIAILSVAIFAGAAIYINVAEHPARMGCDTKTAATVWAPSYKRAYVMQASLAVMGFISGLTVWFLKGSILWLLGATCIGAVIPFTFMVIMPTNQQLLAPERDLSSTETRELLVKWGNLHAVRSILSFIALVIYVALSLKA
ncbi:MAG: DUF1772 domain-containing protein [Methyloglobulus sp.]|nr:DUF1772 domain-containing protein [Methyloglobulus sp.]